jgi:hypothetical protein
MASKSAVWKPTPCLAPSAADMLIIAIHLSRRWTGDCLESGLFRDMFSEKLRHSLAAGFCAQLPKLEVGPVTLGDVNFVGQTARGGAD